jgi:hypothetical protein
MGGRTQGDGGLVEAKGPTTSRNCEFNPSPVHSVLPFLSLGWLAGPGSSGGGVAPPGPALKSLPLLPNLVLGSSRSSEDWLPWPRHVRRRIAGSSVKPGPGTRLAAADLDLQPSSRPGRDRNAGSSSNTCVRGGI